MSVAEINTFENLRCPKCHNHLVYDETQITCSECNTIYPVINGIPVIINADNSVFDLENASGNYGGVRKSGRLSNFLFILYSKLII